MILLLRFLPLFVGVFEAALFWWQRRLPLSYPWIALCGVLLLPLAALLIVWRRVDVAELAEKISPNFICLVALAFGLLLVETPVAMWVIVACAGFVSFLSLELVFLLTYEPASYPVSGLSRLNIATVPLTVWYSASTSVGLLNFLHVSPFWHLGVCAVLGLVLFRTTGHPGASTSQNRLWMLIGGLIGLEIGWVGVLLPLSMPMQGVIAAILFTSALRVRRYLYAPRLPARMAWAESVLALLFLILSLSTAKWL